eukprot:406391-Alexandrium_andersonii.AAC.1
MAARRSTSGTSGATRCRPPARSGSRSRSARAWARAPPWTSWSAMLAARCRAWGSSSGRATTSSWAPMACGCTTRRAT